MNNGLNIGGLIPQVPIIQGGMGVGISLSGLAGAVAGAGGIGVISTAQIGFREPDFDDNPLEANMRAMGKEISRARQLAGDGILGVNIMVATRNYEAYVKQAVKEGIDLIISGAGLPVSLPEYVKGSSTKIAPIVSTAKSAHVICKLWDRKFHRVPDLVVIEGPKAGGHLGFTMEQLEQFDDASYENEVRKIIETVKSYGESYGIHIPVVVAGGIFERRDMDRWMGIGADGVQIGTRFVGTYECDAPDAYKQTYLDASKEDIEIVKSPVGMPGRAIVNPFILRTREGRIPHDKCHLCLEHCKPNEIPYCITDALVNAAKGNVENALLFCGENAYKVNRLQKAADIVEEFRIN